MYSDFYHSTRLLSVLLPTLFLTCLYLWLLLNCKMMSQVFFRMSPHGTHGALGSGFVSLKRYLSKKKAHRKQVIGAK